MDLQVILQEIDWVIMGSSASSVVRLQAVSCRTNTKTNHMEAAIMAHRTTRVAEVAGVGSGRNEAGVCIVGVWRCFEGSTSVTTAG